MSYSNLTVGELKGYMDLVRGFDFSSVDWGEVITFLRDSGLYTPEVATVIEEFASGNFNTLFRGLSLVDAIVAKYPSSDLFSDAVDDYFSKGETDYSDFLPESESPSDLNWGEKWDDVKDQLKSHDIDYDVLKDIWVNDYGLPSEWSVDAVKEFLVAKTYDVLFDKGEDFLRGVLESKGLGDLYQTIQDVKELKDGLTNWHTNTFALIEDGVFERETNLEKYFNRFDRITKEGLGDVLNVKDNIKSAFETLGSGFLEGDAIRAGSTSTNSDSFVLTLSPIKGAFNGSKGNDALAGGSASDKIVLKAGNDFAFGGLGNDTLVGDSGNDRLGGGAGKDKLVGGSGADLLWGGSSADLFVFSSVKDSTAKAAGRDTVLDFSRKQGDRVDLKSIDADSTTKGNQTFDFIGTKKFTKDAGELRYEKKGGDTLIYGDVNGDGKADFSVLFDGTISFRGSDFIL